jgi:hypothetical protein
MSQFRTYFYDLETRKEMTDFEFNGKTWLGTSAMVIDRNGAFVQDTCSFVDVASYADMSKVVGRKTVTIDDFPGKSAVAVKIWYGPNRVEWRKLVKAEFQMHDAHMVQYWQHNQMHGW